MELFMRPGRLGVWIACRLILLTAAALHRIVDVLLELIHVRLGVLDLLAESLQPGLLKSG
jgi:hypothetical protein